MTSLAKLCSLSWPISCGSLPSEPLKRNVANNDSDHQAGNKLESLRWS